MKKIHIAFLVFLLCIVALEGAVLVYRAAAAMQAGADLIIPEVDTVDEEEEELQQENETDGTEEQKIVYGEQIRVLLLNAQGGELQAAPAFSSEGEWTLDALDGTVMNYAAGSRVSWEEACQAFNAAGEETIPEKITIYGNDEHGIYIFSDGGQSREYFGKLYVYPQENGAAIVNEINVEQYLYGVLPSEMPEYFEVEALKAQAVSARSYVYVKMQSYAYPQYEAQIDDSVSFQAYNKQEVSDEMKAAVDETAGMVLVQDGQVAEPFYFSTSWGVTSGVDVWNIDETDDTYLQPVAVSLKEKLSGYAKEKKFNHAIKQVNENDLEAGCKYYRWNAALSMNLDTAYVRSVLEERAAILPGSIALTDSQGQELLDTTTDFGKIIAVAVKERNKSGAVKQILITFENARAEVQNEYTIRLCMAAMTDSISCQDGSVDENPQLLPSAFFTIDGQTSDSNGTVYGGGLGHGVGMSQNGANELAKAGYHYKKILQFFYQNVKIKQIEDLR